MFVQSRVIKKKHKEGVSKRTNLSFHRGSPGRRKANPLKEARNLEIYIHVRFELSENKLYVKFEMVAEILIKEICMCLGGLKRAFKTD